MNEIFHLRGKIKQPNFFSICIYESCQLSIRQFTKSEKSKRVTLLHTMLKILWPLCMLKVPLCWWLVASAGVNKQGFICGRCPQFGRDTGTGNTLCRVSTTHHLGCHLHTNSASHYRFTTPSTTPPPQVPPPARRRVCTRYPVSSLAPSHVSLVPRLDAIHLSKLF